MTRFDAARLPDEDLGRLLGSLDVAWPRTPDLRDAVVAEIAAPADRQPATSTRSRRRRVLLLVAVLIVGLAAAAGAARFLWDLGAVVVRIEPSLTLPGSTLGPEHLWTELPLPVAEAQTGLRAPIPTAWGAPDGVWVDTIDTPGGEGERLALAWAPRDDLARIPGTPWGAVLMVFRGDEEIAAKSLPTTPTVRFGGVDLDGVHGIWIAGPHELELLGPDGVESFTVTGHVLLWSPREDVVLRLETALPKSAAVRIAASLT
jgi:hypothetical protein